MSKQFVAKEIRRLLEPLPKCGFRVGQVFAVDKRGDMFFLAQQGVDDGGRWPRRLYRDYWRYVSWHPTSECGQEIAGMKYKVLRFASTRKGS